MNNNLYSLRENKDLLQKEIVEIIGVHRRTYSSWENDTKIIPLKHLNTLCNYYKVSMDYALNLSKSNNYKNINELKELNKKEIGTKIKIKMIREENSITLRTLADELSTTSSTISAYETGKTLILTAFAYQICKKYKVSLDYLVGRTNNSNSQIKIV